MKRERFCIVTKYPFTTENKPQANINKTSDIAFLIYTCLKLGHIFKVLSDFGGQQHSNDTNTARYLTTAMIPFNTRY
jgi:hypothetical protein